MCLQNSQPVVQLCSYKASAHVHLLLSKSVGYPCFVLSLVGNSRLDTVIRAFSLSHLVPKILFTPLNKLWEKFLIKLLAVGIFQLDGLLFGSREGYKISHGLFSLDKWFVTVTYSGLPSSQT